jgi:branched-chain amino acid transport system substrate-binding protein
VRHPHLVPITLLACCAVLACGGDAPDGPAPIKVGAVFDLTGPTADVGTTYQDGIRGYVEWLNESGGIAGRPIQLLFQDYGYKPDVAEQLYSQFVQEGVVAFQGWGTGDTEALRGRIAEDRIPFMSASYSHVLGDPSQAPFNFLAGTSYTDQFAIVVDWILEAHDAAKGAPKIALFVNPSPFGRSPFDQGGRDYAAARGVALDLHEMPRGSTDFTAELTRITQSGAQYVVFQNTSGPAAVALRNASSLGSSLTFVCLNWCTNEVLVDLAGEAAEGTVGAVLFAPPGEGIEGLRDAEEHLRSKGQSLAEKGMLYGQGWTTMHLMAEGIRRAAATGEVTGDTIKTALETLDGFDTGGVTSPVTLGPNDHWGVDGMRLYRVEGGEWKPLTGMRTASPATTPAA